MPSLRIARGIVCALLFVGTLTIGLRAVGQSRDAASASKPDLVISGEVAGGKLFEREIGNGLIFRLTPSPAGFGNGWDIEIVPKDNPRGGFAEYSGIVTPPYHFYNQRYLNPSYNVTAQEAVGISPRVFQFVETAKDSDAASVVVNSVVYASDWEAHKESIAAEAAKISLGTGELKILDSRITAGKNDEDLGSIDWVKFQVDLRFHSGVTLDKILFPDYSPQK